MNTLLLALCLCGAEPEAQPVGLVQLTYQFGSFSWPASYPLAKWKAAAKYAGDYWESQAAVRFAEVPNAKPRMYRFAIITQNRRGVWGLWTGGAVVISTYPPNLREWGKLNAAQQDQFARSLLAHEMWHALGGRGNHGIPYMIAWLRAKYGPPLPKLRGVEPLEIQPLPPVPRWRDRCPLRQLIRRLETCRVSDG